MVTNGSRYEGSVLEREEWEWELTSTHSASIEASKQARGR